MPDGLQVSSYALATVAHLSRMLLCLIFVYTRGMRSWKNKRVLITGGTGFIGSVLAERLLEEGAQVRIPIRAANYRALSKLRAKIEWVEGDLRNSEYCEQLLSGVDHLFHLAAHRRNVEFHRDHCSDVLEGNVEMSAAMIRAMRGYKSVAVTFFSSANVPPIIDVIRVAQSENIDGYVLGKAVCETLWLAAARQLQFPLLIVRPVGVYGPRDTFSVEGNVIPSLMVKAQTHDVLDVWGDGKQERAFLYVEDLVEAVFRLTKAGASGVQYVIPPDITTVGTLAKYIRDIVRPGMKIAFDVRKPQGGRTIPTLPVHDVLKRMKWTPLKKGLQLTYDGWQQKRDVAASKK